MAIQEKQLIGRQDKLLTFGSTNTLTSAGTYPCGYSSSYTDGTVIDMKNGDLENMGVHFKVDTACAGLTSVVLKVQVSSDKSAWTDAAVSPSILAAALTKDAEFNVVIPRGAPQGRYIRAAVVVTGTGTAGVISACVDTFAGV